MALFLSFEDDSQPKRLSLRERMRLKENEAMSQQVTVKKILRTEQTKFHDSMIETKVKKSVTFETTSNNDVTEQINGFSTTTSETKSLGKNTKTESVDIQQSIRTSRYASNVGERVITKTEKKETVEITAPKNKQTRVLDTNKNITATFGIQTKTSQEESIIKDKDTVSLKQEEPVKLKTNEQTIKENGHRTTPSFQGAKNDSVKDKEEDFKNTDQRNVIQSVTTEKTQNSSKVFDNKNKDFNDQNKETKPFEKRRAVTMTNTTSKFENNNKLEKRPVSAFVENSFEKKTDKHINNDLFPKKTFKKDELKKTEVTDSPKTELNKVNLRKTNDNNKNSTSRPKSLNDFKSKFESKTEKPEINNRRSLFVGNNRSKFEQDDKKAINVNLRSHIGQSDVKNKDNTTPALKQYAEVKKDLEVKKDTLPKDTGKKKEELASDIIKHDVKIDSEINNNTAKVEIAETKSSTNETIPGGMRTTEKIEKVEKVGNVTVKRTETKTTEVKQTPSSVQTIEAKFSRNGTNNTPQKFNLKTNTKSVTIEDKLKDQKRNTRTTKMTKGQNMFKMQINAEAATKPAVNVLESKANSNIDKLLKWIAKRINVYPLVNVTNFTSSWEDGIALCALMHYLLGEEAITPTDVSGTDKLKNFEMAINAATNAGVPALVQPDELVNHGIDRRSMITYLHTVYKVLFADKQPQK